MGIYTGIKEEMINLIENLNLEYISTGEWEETKCELEKCFSVAQYTIKVFETEDAGLQRIAVSQQDIFPDETRSIKPDNEEFSETSNQILESTVSNNEVIFKEWPDSEFPNNEAIPNQNDVEGSGYPFKRLLAGGTLNNDEIYVPEKVVRQLGIAHGDLIRAVFMKKHNNKNIYRYDVVESKNGPDPRERNHFSYGIVKYDDASHSYYADEDIYHNPLLVDGVQSIALLSERDEEAYRLVTDDIVDIAWYDGWFSEAKVIWKHQTDLVIGIKTDDQKIKKHKEREADNVPIKEEVVPTLAGKRICLVGGEPYHAEFKKVIEERGGTLIPMRGDEKKVRINKVVRKSDACIVAIQHVSHDASIYSHTIAKASNVPFESFKDYGKSQFLTATYRALCI